MRITSHPLLLAGLAFAMSASPAFGDSSLQSDVLVSAQIARKIAQDTTVRQAAFTLAAAATNDTDGYAIAPKPIVGLTVIGGGIIPSSSGAPVTDGFGINLGYCAWDNGTSTGTPGYIPGSNNLGAITLAVVSPGADNKFDTTCAQIAAGAAAGGDDYYVAYTAGQLLSGVQGSTYFSDPVNTFTDLANIAAGALKNGQVRLVKDTNRLYRYNSSTGWAGIGTQWVDGATAGDLFYTAGNISVGTNTPLRKFTVKSTAVPIGVASTGNRNGIDLLDATTSVVNAFFGFDTSANQLRIEAQKSGSSLVLATPGGNVSISSAGVLDAPQGITTSGITAGSITAGSITSSGPLSVSGLFTANGGIAATNGAFSGNVSANNVTIAGNQVLHTGNFNTYAPTLGGVGATGTWNININGNAASAATATKLLSQGSYAATNVGNSRGASGVNMYEVYNNGYPESYGNLLHLGGAGAGEILVGWSGTDGAHAPNYIRSKRDNDAGAWSPWALILTDQNAAPASRMNQDVRTTDSPTFAGLTLNGPLSTINGITPTNGAIRLTPNLHLNSGAGNAVILNWDNGTTGNTNTLRVGNGAGADVFDVTATGNVWAAGTVTATTFTGSLNGNASTATYAANSSKLYSTDSSYAYGSGAPYYGYLTYNGGANRWRFQVSPATPSAVEVAYADTAGSVPWSGVTGKSTAGDWVGKNTLVSEMLSWKYYGNNHVIFDASQGTSPNGSGISNVNSTYAWSASYPTLMGWNGANTYGVRVDSARVADSAASVPWSGITSMPSNVFYYQGFTLDANAMASNASGFTYSVNAPWTGPIADFTASGYDLQLNAQYNGGGTAMSFRTRNGDAGSWNGWQQVMTTGNYGSYAIARGGDTVDGTFYFRSNKGSGSYVGGQAAYGLEAYSTDGGAAAMSFHRSGYYAVNFGLDPDNVLRIGGWSAAANRWQLDMNGNNYVAGALISQGGSVQIVDGNTNMTRGDAYSMRVNTPYGWIEIGPQNSGWAHITTDRAGFYFGSPITVNGSISVYGTNNYMDSAGVVIGGNRVIDQSSNVSAASVSGNRFASNQGSQSPDNSHPGYGIRPFYSWNIGQAYNSGAGYSNGITIGSNPGDQSYGFQIVQNMWDDNLYFRRYNAGWQGWNRALSTINDPYPANMNQYLRTTDGATFAALTVNGNVASTGVVSAALLQVNGIVSSGGGCGTPGQIGRDGSGVLYACQN